MTYIATTAKRLRTEAGPLAKKLAAEFELIQNSCNHQAATLIVAASNSLHPERADYVCDGTDDQVQIQAAIDAMTVGGKLSLSEGKFSIGAPINIEKKIIFEGSSIGTGAAPNCLGTRICLENNSNCDMIRVDGNGTHMYFPQFRNFYLYGNKGNQTSGNGIHFINDLSDTVTENIFVTDCKESGVVANYGWYMRYNNVWSEFNGMAGFFLNEGWLTSCVASENDFYGLRGDAPQGIHLVNVRIKRNGRHGIFLRDGISKQISIVASEILQNSNNFAGSYDGICIDGGDNTYFRSIVISDNIIGIVDGTTQRHGINIETGDGISVIGNVMITEHTSTIRNVSNGTNIHIRSNIGFVTENSGTATLANGTTSIVVTHGLAVTPAAGDIVVTPIEAWGNMTQFYIDTYTSTQFTIHADIDPGQDVDFAWKAIIL